METGYKRIIKHSWTRNINWVSKIRPFGWDFIPHINTCFYPLYFICSFLMHILKILWRCKILKVMYHKPSIQFCKSSLFHNTILFHNSSFDLRNNRSKHWMDKTIFQDRAFFYSRKTTSLNAAGVPVVISYLQINQVVQYEVCIFFDMITYITR